MSRSSINIDNIQIKKSKDGVPRAMIILLIAMQILLGVDTGVLEGYKGNVMKTLKSLSQFVLSVRLIVTFTCTYWIYQDMWYWYMLMNVLSCYVFFIRTKYKLFHFITDMHKLGKHVSSLKNNRIGIVLFSYFAIKFILGSVQGVIRCVVSVILVCFEKYISISYITYTFNMACCDAIGIMLILIIYYVYCLVYHLRTNLISKMNLNDFENCYAGLVEIYKKIERLYNHIVIINICFTIPRLMAALWFMLYFIKEEAEWYTFTGEWLYLSILTIQLCIPSVITEMVNGQMDAIKDMLNERLRIEKDNEKLQEVERVLRYMNACSIQSDIWRVIPLDLRLPMTLFSICTTYVIVILQFTHLYD